MIDAKRHGPWAFIAGGSEGTGESFANALAAEGINLVLAARKPAPLAALAQRVRSQHAVEVRELAVDLCDPELGRRVAEATGDVEVGMLIYNAGSGNPVENTDSTRSIRRFHDQPLDNARGMIALNVLGMTTLVHHFAPGMVARRRGGIIIVGSLGAHAGTAHTLAYSAAKSFQHSFAEGLWYELKPYGIDVLGLMFGAIRTPNAERSEMAMDAAAEPDDVVGEGLAHLGVDPIWNAGGLEDYARHLRSLPRAEAATAAAQGIEAYYPHTAVPV